MLKVGGCEALKLRWPSRQETETGVHRVRTAASHHKERNRNMAWAWWLNLKSQSLGSRGRRSVWVQSQHGLHREFKANLYILRSCLINTHTHMHTHAIVHTHTHMLTCMHAHAHIHNCAHSHTCTNMHYLLPRLEWERGLTGNKPGLEWLQRFLNPIYINKSHKTLSDKDWNFQSLLAS